MIDAALVDRLCAVDGLLAEVGRTPEELARTLAAARRLVADVLG